MRRWEGSVMAAKGQQCRSLVVHPASAYSVITDKLLEHMIKHHRQKRTFNCAA
jgi:N-acetylglutamate synthase-like GNAT family acetyltransferase